MNSLTPTNVYFQSFKGHLDNCYTEDPVKRQQALKIYKKIIQKTPYENLKWQLSHPESTSHKKLFLVNDRKIKDLARFEINKRNYCLIKRLGTKYDFRKIKKHQEMLNEFKAFCNKETFSSIYPSEEEVIDYIDSLHEKILLNADQKLTAYPQLATLVGKKKYEKIKNKTGDEVFQEQLKKERMVMIAKIIMISAGIFIAITSFILAVFFFPIPMISLGIIGGSMIAYGSKVFDINYETAKLKNVNLI